VVGSDCVFDDVSCTDTATFDYELSSHARTHAFTACLPIEQGFFEGPFFNFGPSTETIFFGKAIDTWGKWSAIVGYTIVQQLVTTYALETISPWMMNQLQNRRVFTLRESQPTALAIVLLWYTYMWISRVVSIQILLSQIDFLIVVLFVDLLTTFVVTKFYYLDFKRTGVIESIFSGSLLQADRTATSSLNGLVAAAAGVNLEPDNNATPCTAPSIGVCENCGIEAVIKK
jgi:hypothetical protein